MNRAESTDIICAVILYCFGHTNLSLMFLILSLMNNELIVAFMKGLLK